MAEYIEREAAKNILKRHEHRFTCADESNGYGSVKWSEYVIYSETAQNCMDAIPAADVRPAVRGKWITHPRETWIGVDINGNETQPRQFFAYECPFCGFTTGMSGKDYNFCPNCGADMREES